MRKKILKNLLAFGLVLVLTAPILMLQANAQAQGQEINDGLQTITNEISLGSEDPRVIITKVINTTMIFLGIIAVCLILLAGFKWMTSMGNEEKVDEAKKLMGAGVIGLVIILASWGIAQFIISRLQTATGN